MQDKVRKIRDFWDSQASQYGEDLLASTPDFIAKRLEIRALLRFLPEEGRVLDVGCGNGSMTLLLAAERPKMTFVGVDYSQRMIEIAKRNLENRKANLDERIDFEVGNVLALPFRDQSFDCVISDRCLINLATQEEQEGAIKEIGRVMVSNGLYFMCENTEQGLARLNEMRQLVSLYPIQTRWHNLYLDEEMVRKSCEGLFSLETVDHFASLYYIASRVFNAKLASMAGEEPRYDHPINEIAASLPSVGDYGPLRLFVLRRL